MAKKSVVVDINLKGTESISDLESMLENVNSELKNVDRNSASFNKLSEQSRQLQGELHKVDRSLEPITGDEQIESFKKLGEGIAGAFEVGGAAMLIFSEEAQENFEEIAKVVITVVAAMDGLGKIMELFTSNTIRNLKATAVSWKRQAAVVVGASKTMKAALISTGIGALLVGVGLLISNWEKLTKLFDKSEKQRAAALDAEIENQENLINLSESRINLLQSEVNLNNELYKSYSDRRTQIKLLNEEYNNYNKLIREANLELEKAQSETNRERLVEIQEKLNKKQERLNKLQNDQVSGLGQLFSKSEEKLKAQIEELNTEKNSLEINDQLLKNKIQQLTYERDLAVVKRQNTINEKLFLVAAEDINRILEERENTLTVLNAQENKSREIYQEQAKIIDDKIYRQEFYNKQLKNELDSLDEGNEFYELRKKSIEDELAQVEIKLGNLNAEKEALRIQEEIRREQVTIEQERLELQIRIEQELAKQNDNNKNNNREWQRALDLNNELNTLYQTKISKLENVRDIHEYLINQRQNLVNFDKEGYEIFLRNNEALIERVDKYNETFEVQKNILRDSIQEGKVSENILDDEARRLTFIKQISEEKIKQLAVERTNLEVTIQINENNNENLKTLMSIRVEKLNYIESLLREAELNRKNAKNDEEKLKYTREIADLQSQLLTEQEAINGYEEQIKNNNQETKENKEQIKLIEQDITSEKNKQNKAESETNQYLEEQSRTYAKIQNFQRQFNDEIQAAGELIGQTFELLGAVYDNIAAKRQEDLDKWLEQNQDAFDEIESMETSLKKRQENLTEMLIDAEGDRYDQIKDELNEINGRQEENAQREQELLKQRAEMQYKIDLAEWKSTKMNKTASIADAAINTAVAITQSLPNVVLTAIVSALGAAQIATISATPIPEKPEAPKMQTGGYISGRSHSQGGELRELEDGEYVINRKSTDKYRELLEAINNAGKMQNGGEVTSRPSSSASSTPLIDYDRMTQSFVDAVRQQNIFVSVKEINTVNKRLQAVESKTSL